MSGQRKTRGGCAWGSPGFLPTCLHLLCQQPNRASSGNRPTASHPPMGGGQRNELIRGGLGSACGQEARSPHTSERTYTGTGRHSCRKARVNEQTPAGAASPQRQQSSCRRGDKGPGQSGRLPRTAPPTGAPPKGTPHPKAAKPHPAQSPLPQTLNGAKSRPPAIHRAAAGAHRAMSNMVHTCRGSANESVASAVAAVLLCSCGCWDVSCGPHDLHPCCERSMLERAQWRWPRALREWG
jgi:hypothetical protein